MSPFLQIVTGSALILVCAAIQIVILVGTIRIFRHRGHTFEHWLFRNDFSTSAVIFLAVLVSHTIHVYLWAFAFLYFGTLPGLEAAVYFALASYTTVGYGDVVLPDNFRIFGAMSAVIGLLGFGMSTAFLVAFYTRMLDR